MNNSEWVAWLQGHKLTVGTKLRHRKKGVITVYGVSPIGISYMDKGVLSTCDFTELAPMSYKERQAAWVKEQGLKVGDRVKVLRTFEDHEDGYTTIWDDLIDKTVGAVGTISCIGSGFISVCFGSPINDFWQYPYFVLEPVKEPTYKERQAAWIEEHGLKVGDKVKVLRSFEDEEDVCNLGWPSSMDETVGAVGTISCIGSGFISVCFGSPIKDWWRYPYFVLEPVKRSFKYGQVVLVRDRESDPWYVTHFLRVNGNGTYRTFSFILHPLRRQRTSY